MSSTSDAEERLLEAYFGEPATQAGGRRWR